MPIHAPAILPSLTILFLFLTCREEQPSMVQMVSTYTTPIIHTHLHYFTLPIHFHYRPSIDLTQPLLSNTTNTPSIAWSIHRGSCGYSYIGKEEHLGWNVAAIYDVSPSYIGSCGICIEVKCRPGIITDGYGESLNRDIPGVCRDTTTSLVLRVTDTCPCLYPDNAYSNKRWCCGDKNHLDMSVWAFERLAGDLKWGVIPIEYRGVPCDWKPGKEAPEISNPTPGEDSPPGWMDPQRGSDWRTWKADSILSSDSADIDGLVSSSSSSSAAINSVVGLNTTWSVQVADTASILPSLEPPPDTATIQKRQQQQQAILPPPSSSPLTGTITASSPPLTDGVVCYQLSERGSYMRLTAPQGTSPFTWATAVEFWTSLSTPFNMPPYVTISLLDKEEQPIPGCAAVPLHALVAVDKVNSVSESVDGNTAVKPLTSSWVKFKVGSGSFLDVCTEMTDEDVEGGGSNVVVNRQLSVCGSVYSQDIGGLQFTSLLDKPQAICINDLRVITEI